jgi:hypothetical protein
MRENERPLTKTLTGSIRDKIIEKFSSDRMRELRCILCCVILGVGLLIIHLKLFIYPSDDAYIHFRVAEHLLDGAGPYFNPSDPVKTTSSTVWTLGIAMVFLLVGRSVASIAFVNTIVLTAGGIFFGRLVYECTGIRAAYWLACLLYVSISLRASVGLMEVPLALLLTAAGLLLLRHGGAQGFTLLAVAAFCRPEMSLCMFVYFAYCVLQKKLSVSKVIFWSAIGALPFLLFDLYFFGTVVPHAIHAKAVVYAVTPIDTVREFVTAALPDRLLTLTFPAALQWMCLLVISGLAVVAWAMADIRVHAYAGPAFLLPLMASSLGVGVIYVASATHLHLWYVPLVLAPIAVSIVPAMVKNKPASIMLTIIASLTFGILPLQAVAASAISPILWPDFETGARVRKYLEVGEFLYRQYPKAALLTSEIGGLGYSFKGAIIDGCGLASPRALRYHPLKVPQERSSGKIGAIPANLVAEMRPELIVTYDAFGEALLRRHDIMSQYTHLVTSFYITKDMARWRAWRFRYGSFLHVLVRKDIKALSPLDGR